MSLKTKGIRHYLVSQLRFLGSVSIVGRVNSFAWYALAYGGSAAILKGAGFILFMWLARSLPVEDYAKFGLLYALQTGLTTFSIAGIGESVVGLLKEHKSPTMQRELFCTADVAFMLMALVSGLAAIALWLFVGFGVGSFHLVLFAVIAGVLSAFSTLQAGFERLKEKHVTSLTFSFVVPMTGFVTAAICFLTRRTISMYFFGFAAGLFLSLIVCNIRNVRGGGFLSYLLKTPLLFQRIGPFIVITFFGWLNGYGNNYFVKWFFTLGDVARFTLAYTLASTMQLVASSLNQVWSPRFYQIVFEQNANEVERMNRKFFRCQALVMGIVGGFIIAAFPKAIGIIGGQLITYKGMVIELFLLFSGYIVLAPFWHCQNYFLATGKGREYMKVMLGSSLVGVTLWVGFMWLFGPIGIYLGFFTQMVIRMLGTVISAKKYWPIRIAWDGVAAGILLLAVGLVVS